VEVEERVNPRIGTVGLMNAMRRDSIEIVNDIKLYNLIDFDEEKREVEDKRKRARRKGGTIHPQTK